jgi:hypothetical protein
MTPRKWGYYTSAISFLTLFVLICTIWNCSHPLSAYYPFFAFGGIILSASSIYASVFCFCGYIDARRLERFTPRDIIGRKL